MEFVTIFRRNKFKNNGSMSASRQTVECCFCHKNKFWKAAKYRTFEII